MDPFQAPHVDAVVKTVDLELEGAKSIFGCVMPDLNDNLYCIPPMHSWLAWSICVATFFRIESS